MHHFLLTMLLIGLVWGGCGCCHHHHHHDDY
jgi:hypothetical protein